MRGTVSPMWMTYVQAQKLGGQVRKGEKSATVVKFGKMVKDGETDPVTGAAGDDRRIPYARAYRVFNVEQIDGLDADCIAPPEPPRDFGTKNDLAANDLAANDLAANDLAANDLAGDPVLDAWFASLGVPIKHSPEPQAYYAPARDRIHMPPVQTFESLHRYFHVLAHEHAHATKHSSRLDRHHSGKTRVQRYAQEEIVADLAGVMVCARLGITPSFDQSAAYLQHWVDVLKTDHRAIVKAASMAQAAADWMFDAAGECPPRIEEIEPPLVEPAWRSRGRGCQGSRLPDHKECCPGRKA